MVTTRKVTPADAASCDPDPFTHLANAHRIVREFGDRLLFVEGIGWHTWGPPWKEDTQGALRMVQPLGRLIAQETADLPGDVNDWGERAERNNFLDCVKRRIKWASRSENLQDLRSSLAMTEPLLSCRADELDADPMLLGLPSQVLDLATGMVREHRQSDRITKSTAVDLDANAKTPVWEKFLGEIMGGDEALIRYLQRLVGYSLSGIRNEHILPILWGNGGNGKSTFLGAIQGVLGTYATSAPPGLIVLKSGSNHPTDLAHLQGKRLVVVSETGEASRLNEEQVKLLTGGDLITARRMRMDFYTFPPSHQLLLQTNYRPCVRGNDEGIWRRLRLIPFTKVIAPNDRDPMLSSKLREEQQGILAWIVRGYQDYQKSGFGTPSIVLSATEEFRTASDAVGQFIAERCMVDPLLSCSSQSIYSAYAKWCEQQGEHSKSQRDFGACLKQRGFDQTRTGSVRGWRGLSVAANATGDARDADF